MTYETSAYTRKRKRRPHDQAVFEKQVSVIVANLAQQAITGDYRSILVQRSHRHLGSRSRYQPSFVTKALAKVIDVMREIDLLDQIVGERANPFAARGEATQIIGSEVFQMMVLDANLELEDFDRLLPQETIVLKDEKASRWDQGRLIDYSDTEQTIRWRQEMSAINEWIA